MDFDCRLICDAPFDGPANMARDEAIARAVCAGEQRPTLRLYRWEPPCVSLGKHQEISAVNEAACRADGVDIVRRPTGGLAILHTDELTYSLSLPASHPIAAGGLVASYRRIARAIVETLTRLGVPGAGADSVVTHAEDASAACFETPTDYEVMGGGRKLVGSAQWRRPDGLMQHGSMPLCGDIARVCRYLACPPDAERVREHAGTVGTAAGRSIGWEEAADAWRAAFADVLRLAFTREEVSSAEQRAANLLRASRYAHATWTRRR